jgi:chromosomal replication initiation ATPase DnaA
MTTSVPASASMAGYSQAFLKQTKEARARAVKAELQRLGLATYRSWGMPDWARAIMRDVSERRDVCVNDMASASRNHKISRARNEAIYLVKARKPMLSSPQLGRWFNRDHTSILYSISSYQERNGLPRLVAYDFKSAQDRMRNYAAAKRDAA